MAFPLPLLKPKAIDVSDLLLFDFQKFLTKRKSGKAALALYLQQIITHVAAGIRRRKLS